MHTYTYICHLGEVLGGRGGRQGRRTDHLSQPGVVPSPSAEQGVGGGGGAGLDRDRRDWAP